MRWFQDSRYVFQTRIPAFIESFLPSIRQSSGHPSGIPRYFSFMSTQQQLYQVPPRPGKMQEEPKPCKPPALATLRDGVQMSAQIISPSSGPTTWHKGEAGSGEVQEQEEEDRGHFQGGDTSEKPQQEPQGDSAGPEGLGIPSTGETGIPEGAAGRARAFCRRWPSAQRAQFSGNAFRFYLKCKGFLPGRMPSQCFGKGLLGGGVGGG